VKRELSFKEEYISCVTCAVCYDQNNLPTFCQDGITIDPRDVLGNMARAKACQRWWPHGVSRIACGPEREDNERWYEKDSMA